jgi:hypothetical protein
MFNVLSKQLQMKITLTLFALIFFLFFACAPTIKVGPRNTDIVKDLGRDKIESLRSDTATNTAKMKGNICPNVLAPKTLGELNLKDVFSSNVSVSVGASLSSFGFSGSMGRKDVMVASYFVAYKDYSCGPTTKRALVGIRLYVHASDLKVKVATPTLPQISAAVELGLAKAEYRIQLIGIDPPNFYSNLPSASFDVDTYSKVISSYDQIISSLSSTTAIDPLIATVQNGTINTIN